MNKIFIDNIVCKQLVTREEQKYSKVLIQIIEMKSYKTNTSHK